MLGRALIKRALLTGNLCSGVNSKSFDPACNVLLVKTLTYNSVNHAQQSKKDLSSEVTTILGRDYNRDDWSNVTPNIINNIGRNLHLQKDHPICLIKEVRVRYMNEIYQNVKSKGRPRSHRFVHFFLVSIVTKSCICKFLLFLELNCC